MSKEDAAQTSPPEVERTLRAAQGDGQGKSSVDGYWLRMARLSLESLNAALRADLTEQERNAVVEYLGGILDDAHNSGIRLGNLQARLQAVEQK